MAAEIAATASMKLIDALHVATAISSGCKFFLTNDRGIRSSEQLEVIVLSTLLQHS